MKTKIKIIITQKKRNCTLATEKPKDNDCQLIKGVKLKSPTYKEIGKKKLIFFFLNNGLSSFFFLLFIYLIRVCVVLVDDVWWG